MTIESIPLASGDNGRVVLSEVPVEFKGNIVVSLVDGASVVTPPPGLDYTNAHNFREILTQLIGSPNITSVAVDFANTRFWDSDAFKAVVDTYITLIEINKGRPEDKKKSVGLWNIHPSDRSVLDYIDLKNFLSIQFVD